MAAELALDIGDADQAQEKTGEAPDQALTSSQFFKYIEDIRHQAPWRHEADRAVDYYDNNQLDSATLAALEAKGMGPLITNIISPIVNVVLGMEAKTRADWRVTADDDATQPVAEALSAKLHEVERETHANMACSQAYAGQIKAGVGWAEVWRNANPFEYPYRAVSVHRREIFWDWRDQDLGLSKARYLVRKRWYDVDQAIIYFPQFKDLLNAAISGDPNRFLLEANSRSIDLGKDFFNDRGLSFEDMEDWRAMERRRICLYEVWYRVFVRGYVLRLPNGEVYELNMKNPVHVALLARGMAKPEKAVYNKMRMSVWAGPIRMCDVACDKNVTPYVPFWGYREDRTGVPYGLVRAMISPQDEVNARRQKMMWLLGAKRLEMDADALDAASNTLDTVLNELSRPDAVVILNKDRKNRDAFKVETDFGLAEQQFKILQESKQAAQEVVGVFNAMLGRESSANSGIAINSLVEQGTTALAEINDNYRYARNLVGERLVDMIRDDLMGQNVNVMVGEVGKRKTISLNQPAQHPQTGAPTIANSVRGTKVKVGLEDVPSTASYRQQQFTMISEMTKSLPPQMQAVIAPFVMEASDLQKRREMADALRKAMGQNEPQSPEEEQALMQQQQEQQAIQQETIALELAERRAKVEKLTAEAHKIEAELANGGANAGEMDQHRAESGRVLSAAMTKIDSLTAQLLAERSNSKLREMSAKVKLQHAAMRGETVKNQGEDNAREARDAKLIEGLQRQIDAVMETVTAELAKLGAKAKKPALQWD